MPQTEIPAEAGTSDSGDQKRQLLITGPKKPNSPIPIRLEPATRAGSRIEDALVSHNKMRRSAARARACAASVDHELPESDQS